MKKIKFFIFLTIILIFPSSFLIKFYTSLTSNTIKLHLSKTSDIIHIVGNQGWIDFKNAGNCTGEGTYSDPYVIKDLIIDSEGTGSCILVEFSDVYFRIENCTLVSSTPNPPIGNGLIELNDVKNAKIFNNSCSNNRKGIFCTGYNTKNVSIENNSLINNTTGIHFRFSRDDNCFIKGNMIISDVDAAYNPHGIYVDRTSNLKVIGNSIMKTNSEGITISLNWHDKYNTISNNSLRNCGIRINTERQETFLENEITDSNIVNNKPVFYYVNKTGLIPINFSNAGQVILAYCNDSILSNLNVFNTTSGISLYYCRNVTISNTNSSFNNLFGLELRHSNNCSILRNLANSNGNSGLHCDDLNNTLISNNTFYFNMRGMFFKNSYNNNVSKNIANYNIDPNSQGIGYSGAGIILFNSINISIVKNDLSFNMYDGIYLKESECVIEYNFFNRNKESGINIYNNYEGEISNNLIVGNDKTGILLYNSKYMVIENNEIYNNSDIGISLQNCNDNIILKNNITESELAIDGEIENFIFNNFSSSNIINGKRLYNYYNKKNLGNYDFLNAGMIILINCSDSLISNINITNSVNGIVLYNCFNNQISYNFFSHIKDFSLYLKKSENNSIFNNNIDESDKGISFENSNNSIILNNSLFRVKYFGLNLKNSKSISILSNIIEKSQKGIYFENTNESIVVNNQISVTEFGVLLKNSNNDLISNNSVLRLVYSSCGINLENSKNISILSNIIEESQKGIYLENTNESIVVNNQISLTNFGVLLKNSNNDLVSNNSFLGITNYGLNLENSKNISILANIIEDSQKGIYLENTNVSIITSNFVSNSNFGIYLLNGTSCNILNNSIMINQHGIFLDGSFHIKIINNSIENNDYNIVINKSQETQIFLNRFINSTLINAIDNGFNNHWDNGIVGNFWDDYDGLDLNDDGIGDSPYNISGSAKFFDRYPIWDDGDDIKPIIFVNYPSNGTFYGSNPPNFNIRIIEENLDSVWYTLNEDNKKYFITENGTIDNQAWYHLSYGLITLKFHANDTNRNYNSTSIIVIKDNSLNPSPFFLYTDADAPDTDGRFNLTWDVSAGANSYSLFMSNGYIAEINESLTVVLHKSNELDYQMHIYNNDDYYFIVVAYNETGYTYSNCIKVVTELPTYFLGFEVGDEIIWKITNITDLATKFKLNAFNIPKSTSYLGARMKFTIKNITSVTRMEPEPYEYGYWNVTLDIWNWTLDSFSPEPDLKNTSGLVPKHAFGLNLISYFCPSPPFEYFSQFEIPPSSYVNVTGTTVTSFSMANGEIIVFSYSFDNETGVQSRVQYKYANGTIIYEHILVSVSKPIINPPISIPFGGFFIIVLIITSFGIIFIYRKFDSVESILED